MPKTSIQIKINGQPMTIRQTGSSIQRISRLLLALPDDEVITTDQVKQRADCPSPMSYVQVFARQGMTLAIHPRRIVWGNPRAISALRSQLENR